MCEDGHAFSCAARRGGGYECSCRTRWGFGRDAEFLVVGGGTRLGWVGEACQTERLKVKFFGLGRDVVVVFVLWPDMWKLRL
jgi:hypothetical protein